MRLGFVFAISLIALLPAGARADEWNKHWSVGPKPELRISAGEAAVIVTGVAGNSIDAHLTTTGWKIAPGNVQVTEHQTGDSVEIDVKVPPTHFGLGNRSIRLEVHVPKQLSSDIRTGDGSLELRDLHGELHVNTGDGGIEGHDLEGSLDAHSGDGGVRVAGRFDHLRLQTSDGSIDLNADPGSQVKSEWQLQTGDGSVTVHVPHDLAADLEMHSGDGSINVHANQINVTQSESGHDYKAKLNGGGSLISIHTGDGSISFGS